MFVCILFKIKYFGVFIIIGRNIFNKENVDDVGLMCDGFCF